MLTMEPQYPIATARRRALAPRIAGQILATCLPYLRKPLAQLRVLDVGCGYGDVAMELARRCGSVTAIDPCPPVIRALKERPRRSRQENLAIRCQSATELQDQDPFDLIVLDNTLEHVADQERMLKRMVGLLARGGVLYLIVPNKLWPLEVHYRLPFLSYLPLPWASAYLRLTGRGTDYRDASYAPTYWRMKRLLQGCPELVCEFVVPTDMSAAEYGESWHYRLGAALLRRCPALWVISKLFVIVGRKVR